MPLASSPEKPVPLREVATAVKGWIERLGAIWVSAQVIELSRKTGVTHFLTLRDATAEVSVSVTLSTAVLDAAGPIAEGMAVTAQLKPTVWLKSGRLSYECFDLRPTGEGQLLAYIEHLKRLLQAEGLFSPALKRPLPYLPRGIGLITAKDSAAERDVVTHARLRWPAARIVTTHALMQGPSTVDQVSQALRAFDADPTIDVIVVARGGGSVEDLLPFSDEALVRTAAAITTPLVSAIGHEVDTPILDLVADLRASTPTDAAKRIVPDVGDELTRLAGARRQLGAALLRWFARQAGAIQHLRSRPVLRDPLARFGVYQRHIDGLRQQLRRAVATRLNADQAQIDHARALVTSLSPQSTLGRGYAILVDSTGATVSSTGAAAPGDRLRAHIQDGYLGLTVTDKEKNHGHQKT